MNGSVRTARLPDVPGVSAKSYDRLHVGGSQVIRGSPKHSFLIILSNKPPILGGGPTT